MRLSRIILCAVMSAAWLMVSSAPVDAADRLSGTWTLNVAKSKFGTGAPPKSQTTRLEEVDGGLREIVERANADGTTTRWDLTAKFDGKDHPVTGDPSRDTVALRKIDDNTVEVTNKKSGKITTQMRIVVAPDGKTRTNTVMGTDAQGQKFTTTMFFDRK